MRDSTRIGRVAATLALTAACLAPTAGAAQAMSNGHPVPRDSAPWFASVLFRDGAEIDGITVTGARFDRDHCGGALIDARTVLTAAHCVVEPSTIATRPTRALPASRFQVVLGDRRLSDPQTVERSISRIDVDPAFSLVLNPRDPGKIDSAAARNDLAFLTLSRPVPAAPTIALSMSLGLPGMPLALYGHGLTPGFNAATDARIGAARWSALRAHLHF